MDLELTKKTSVADDWGLPVSVSSVGRLQACAIAPGFSVWILEIELMSPGFLGTHSTDRAISPA